ncbi:unnamed protein product [Owenia fusiformis]|uniref:Tyr recombinase domain-containing protein n=1 Tax=Owenia fusiformis TaxID=6347 RepID=A0A8S4PX00_OWEFU|nr:unnamed protein product [Owenia fusiformis]
MDVFRRGVSIPLYATDALICPVKAVQRFWNLRKRIEPLSPDDPFFLCQNGEALSRMVFIAKMRHNIASTGRDPKLFNGHSFRIGASTQSSKALGRWKGDTYRRYIRTPNVVIKQGQLVLTRS